MEKNLFFKPVELVDEINDWERESLNGRLKKAN
jgi:hypothetical protein